MVMMMMDMGFYGTDGKRWSWKGRCWVRDRRLEKHKRGFDVKGLNKEKRPTSKAATGLGGCQTDFNELSQGYEPAKPAQPASQP